ncbi:DUF1830 domain-containing protein [Leptolyngbya sp. CCNP1308]|uniref:DUF1830 domain-containing protein n=1 Tax=Leptolyngbya sp. CCNP1308 TaxID=3110255 RepID=UPI002B2044A7|nr:DUF1830 domain-containing protein [Leptolyngbya sp. CCNP1308]MEA5451865.1 DUF1830 domain-containing protein [Leptolyngbya sp. CCNP1308]
MSLGAIFKVRCRYSNPTEQFQIVRVVNQPHFFFERTIVPRGAICFEASLQDTLEIHTGAIAGAILSDRIPCDRLQNIPSEARRI